MKGILASFRNYASILFDGGEEVSAVNDSNAVKSLPSLFRQMIKRREVEGESLGFWVCWAGSPQSVREKRGALARCFEVIWGTPRSAWPALTRVRFTSKPLLSVSLARGERARKQDSKARTLVERHISFEILSMFHFPPHLIIKYLNTESTVKKQQCPKLVFPKGQ